MQQTHAKKFKNNFMWQIWARLDEKAKPVEKHKVLHVYFILEEHNHKDVTLQHIVWHIAQLDNKILSS